MFEVPALGLGHFFYVPVALLALALGVRAGLAGGVLATALYALAIAVTPRLPVRDVLTAATAIRLVTYGTVGGLTDVARVGGDEFALLLDGSVPEVQAICAGLTRALARDGLEISFGWAARPEDGESSIELFRKADDRLYAAKLLARNRRTVVALPTVGHS